MPRLKFLVFAVLALGLWGYHLTLVGPAALIPAVDAANQSVLAAPSAVALRIESRRSQLQAAALKLAGSPAVLNPGPRSTKPEAPTADRFSLVRTAVHEALPEALRDAVALGLVTEGGALFARGAAEAAAPPEGLDLQALVTASAPGTLATLEGQVHLVYAVPLLVADRNEVKSIGSVVLALPALPAGVAEALAAERRLSALGIGVDGAAVDEGGPNKPAIGMLLKGGQAAVTPTAEGATREVGPLKLPLFAGRVVREVGVKVALEGTPFTVVAAASVQPAVDAAAAYETFGLGGLIGLLLLTVVFVLLIRGAEEQGGGMFVPAAIAPPTMLRPPESPPEGALPPAFPPAPDFHEPQEASPDDFDFPSSPSQQLQAPPAPPSQGGLSGDGLFDDLPRSGGDGGPVSDPFARMAPPPAPARAAPPPRAAPPVTAQSPAHAPASNPFGQDEDDGERTAAYPSFKPPGAAGPASGAGLDPFALAAGQEPQQEYGGGEDYNPDATRVAAVPQELIKAARSGGSSGPTQAASRAPSISMPKVQSVAPAGGGGSEEDRHFQEVFRDFVATREKCGEAADGLTFDKFRLKLHKNKEQLVAKYNCRTVRFQVYVKDGKAALKATPVKD